jgi:hypothetical protein
MARKRATTSPGSGKRSSALLEKTSRPSAVISNRPPLEATSSLSIPSACFSSAARPAALGL